MTGYVYTGSIWLLVENRLKAKAKKERKRAGTRVAEGVFENGQSLSIFRK